MVRSSAPAEIVAFADERAAARSARDFDRADRLRARIEAAGWRIVDLGPRFKLEPSRPADRQDGEQTLYGAVESVPSRLHEPASTEASVIVIAADGGAPDEVLAALAATTPPGTQVLSLADPRSQVRGPATEVITTAVTFSSGDALQAALRRTTGAVVIVIEPARVPSADIVTPLVEALRDPQVAIAAAAGLNSADLHRYGPVEHGHATTVAAGCYAFRRADAVERGPIDGRLRLARSVAAWLGLVLRDEGPEAEPRRALIIDLPLRAAEEDDLKAPDHARLARRDRYRIALRFRGQPWLAGYEPPQGRFVGDGPDKRQDDDDAHEADHADDTQRPRA